MNKTTLFASTTVSSLLVAVSIASPVFACHPVGSIQKSVQNVTTNSVVSDANDASTAVTATTGDTLAYTVTVSNKGAVANKNDNDLTKTVMTDTLPAGVELVSSPTQRTITEDFGTLAPGKSITKTYTVKVTSTTDGDVITNKACFNGDGINNNTPQTNCDVAVVKVHVAPKTTPTPVTPTTTTPTTPTVTAKPVTPATLPNTGASTTIPVLAGLTALVAYFLRLRSLKQNA